MQTYVDLCKPMQTYVDLHDTEEIYEIEVQVSLG